MHTVKHEPMPRPSTFPEPRICERPAAQDGARDEREGWAAEIRSAQRELRKRLIPEDRTLAGVLLEAVAATNADDPIAAILHEADDTLTVVLNDLENGSSPTMSVHNVLYAMQARLRVASALHFRLSRAPSRPACECSSDAAAEE